MDRKLTRQEKILKHIKRNKKRTLVHSLIALIVTVVLMGSISFLEKPKVVRMTKDPDTVFMASFVGDIMLGRNVEEVTKHYGQEYLFRNVKGLFQQSDYVSGNFEHPVLLKDGYEQAEKSIHLHTTSESVASLKKVGFSVLTLANNHTMDYGEAGLRDTLQTFEEVGLDFVGAGLNVEEASKISYQTYNGVTVAMVGISDSYVRGATALKNRAGLLSADPSIVLPVIKEAKSKGDLVMVNVHWGQEYDNEPSPRQQELARAMADAGADVIIGHHPHVLSSVEVYGDSLIFYSLGNFVFDQGWSRTRDSAVVNYQLAQDGIGRFEIIPLRIKEATPSAIGTLGSFQEQRIFRTLTKGTTSKTDWKKEDGKLVFEVDHSHVLKGELSIAE